MAVAVPQGWTRPVVFTQAPPSLPSEQLSLFPRKTLFELSKTKGLDIYQYVQADNGRKYYLKLDRDGRYVRASEWLAYRLANLIGVSTPRCDCIQTFNGDIAFGSEDITGAHSQTETVLYLRTSSMNELGQPTSGLRASLSAIHALDLFLNNIDRHYENFLVTGHGEERQLVALDYARSMFWDWPITGFPGSNDLTNEVWIELRERHGFDLVAAEAVIDRLGIISPELLSSIIGQMPDHWLPQSVRNEFTAYCRDGAWAARVAELRRGLGNGSIV